MQLLLLAQSGKFTSVTGLIFLVLPWDYRFIISREYIINDEPISKLEKLSALKEKGIISDKEFETVKTRLLSEI
jgi:hypothetical protein